MKKYLIFSWVLVAATGFAQTSNGLLLGSLNKPKDINSCYQATPALVRYTQPEQVLFQSTDQGTSWIDLSKGLPAGTEVNFLLPKDEGLYLGTRNGELYYNTNPQTGNWVLQTIEGKTTDGFVAGIFSGNSGIFASIWQEGLYQLVPGTHTWKPVQGGLEKQTIFSVVESPNGILMAGGEYGIYQSKNGGISWSHVYTQGWVNSLANESNIWVAHTNDGLIRSADQGEHWDLVLPEVAGNFELSIIDGYWVAIRKTGDQSGSQPNYSYVTLSVDGGLTWKNMDAGQPANSQVFDLEKSGNYLFSSRKAGISRSADFGKTWQLLLAPEAGKDIMQFDMVISNTTLFAYLRPAGC
jgi:hypothetical protein